MHSPSLRSTKPRRKAAPVAPIHDISVYFHEWRRARTEVPNSPSGWTSFEALYRDFAAYLILVGEGEAVEIPPVTPDDFRKLMSAQGWRSRPQTVRAIGSVLTTMAHCWNARLLPPVRR